MPRIVLPHPFIRHYAGSVFDLPDDTVISGWPDDDRLREKQSFAHRQAYFLPDAGNGRPAELLVADTVPCPPEVFAGVDLCAGPCRITSVAGAEHFVELRTDDMPPKNHLALRWPADAELSVTVLSRPDEQPVAAARWLPGEGLVDFSACRPGFYLVRVEVGEQPPWECTVIKCFPLVVTVERGAGRWRVEPAVW